MACITTKTEMPGQTGVKNLMEQYGERLLSVRYKYDQELMIFYFWNVFITCIKKNIDNCACATNLAVYVQLDTHKRCASFPTSEEPINSYC